MRWSALLLLLATTTVVAVRARGAGPEGGGEAAFALIVGVNRSIDRELHEMRYADDDAARYFDLFRALGLRTYILTRPDRNTRRLHPQAAAEAYPPRRAELARVVGLLAKDIRRARRRGLRTVLYLVYAGHGNVRQGRGYLGLEDHRLTGRHLRERVIDRAGADRSHVIVDACHSYFLAHSRGPGGRRRELHGFARMGQALVDARIGLLLSTSTARESHEWEAFQAGVFSHEVRSGLYGAADVDGDGRVSYREIAAFVHRANVAIPNERYRPRVYARPPEKGEVLLDLRRGRRRRLEIDPQHAGRYLVETATGVRLADFHSGPTQALSLVRPPSAGLLYLRRLSDEQEYAVRPGPAVVRVAALTATRPRVGPRGAAHHAFSLVFSRPFDRQVVVAYRLPSLPTLAEQPSEASGSPRRSAWRSYLAIGGIGAGAAALASGIYLTLSARRLRDDIGSGQSNEEVAGINESIDRRNIGAVVLYSVGGAAVVTGVVALLWPGRRAAATVGVSPDGVSFAMRGSF
jgi:hypothetical protein